MRTKLKNIKQINTENTEENKTQRNTEKNFILWYIFKFK